MPAQKSERQDRSAGGHAAPGREGREMPQPDRETDPTREAREREGGGSEERQGGERERRGPAEREEAGNRPAHVGSKRQTTAADLARENE